MQDRFKFRHWDKRINKMFYPTKNDNFGYYVNNSDIIETMQCTGLKDKNGKLIYESDIIKVGNGSINGSVIETIREVKWVINTWNVPVWVVDKPNFSHYVEVIGNIYENKELLNENT